MHKLKQLFREVVFSVHCFLVLPADFPPSYLLQTPKRASLSSDCLFFFSKLSQVFCWEAFFTLFQVFLLLFEQRSRQTIYQV